MVTPRKIETDNVRIGGRWRSTIPSQQRIHMYSDHHIERQVLYKLLTTIDLDKHLDTSFTHGSREDSINLYAVFLLSLLPLSTTQKKVYYKYRQITISIIPLSTAARQFSMMRKSSFWFLIRMHNVTWTHTDHDQFKKKKMPFSGHSHEIERKKTRSTPSRAHVGAHDWNKTRIEWRTNH